MRCAAVPRGRTARAARWADHRCAAERPEAADGTGAMNRAPTRSCLALGAARRMRSGPLSQGSCWERVAAVSCRVRAQRHRGTEMKLSLCLCVSV
ncbi:MAG: hypothetical protein AVDCRST_MAG68-2956 [uncultured Gemmatimonadetes bacterium]|uniref:Uncharacterized protein n=1 Tax=uncultured Gemmatimonadota bacterium TaxID=203437 RepID=A0A6J4LU75_9BACT|nr:MAG: hypothetical protein AVDCRST_MAG68-2956 [uncultured Gemmatimonadota bacterium]